MVSCGVLWCPVVSCGVLWCPVGPCGVLWCPVGPCGDLWDEMIEAKTRADLEKKPVQLDLDKKVGIHTNSAS